MSEPNKVPVERRLHTRHRARTRVHIRPEGKESKMCVASNLSANGVAVKTEGMGLRAGMICELSFAIDLGSVVKIHKRMGRVTHVRNGVTGFAMEAFGTKSYEHVP